MAMLAVNDIHVYYGSIHAVKGVSLEVNEGEIVTLIGANGAGKSTVLNTISGLLHPRGGSVTFMGQDLKGVPPHKLVARGMAQVPEGRRIFLQMTVEENLEMGAYTQSKASIDGSIEDVYRRFPRLQERRKQIAGTLSGGELKRIELASAIAKGGEVFLLDEPEAGIDLWSFEDLVKVFEKLHDKTVIIVSHQQRILETADKIVLFDNDKLICAGKREEMFSRLMKQPSLCWRNVKES